MRTKEPCPHYDPENICDCPYPNMLALSYVCVAWDKLQEQMFEEWRDKKHEREEKETKELRFTGVAEASEVTFEHCLGANGKNPWERKKKREK